MSSSFNNKQAVGAADDAAHHVPSMVDSAIETNAHDDAQQTPSDEAFEAEFEIIQTPVVRPRALSTGDMPRPSQEFLEIPKAQVYSNGDPIERFRLQYGEQSALLRERSYPIPHPQWDHAWQAAGHANKFGLYEPCQSYEQDLQQAIDTWHKENLDLSVSQCELELQKRVEGWAEKLLSVQRGFSAASVIIKKEMARRFLNHKLITYANHYGGTVAKLGIDTVSATASMVAKTRSERRGEVLMKKIEAAEKKRAEDDYLEVYMHTIQGDEEIDDNGEEEVDGMVTFNSVDAEMAVAENGKAIVDAPSKSTLGVKWWRK